MESSFGDLAAIIRDLRAVCNNCYLVRRLFCCSDGGLNMRCSEPSHRVPVAIHASPRLGR